MYEAFFGFKEKPFNLVPNPGIFYLSSKHRNAMTHLEYGLMEAVEFILLTGDIGTGKTTLIRNILNQIESSIDIAYIVNTNATPIELLHLILEEFEVPCHSLNKAEVHEKLNSFLIQRYAEGRRVLLIIDEGQNLSIEALEEVRMISNLQTDDKLLLQILLVGQPELKKKIKSPQLVQLSQRIAIHFHLSPMSDEETTAYIQYRIEYAGGDADIFSEKAIERIFQASYGTPRIINLICDAALVYAYADEKKTVDANTIEQVIADRGELSFSIPDSHEDETPFDTSYENNDRLLALETDIKFLKKANKELQTSLTELSSKVSNNEINKFYTLYLNEKKRASDVYAAYIKLKEKYQALKAEKKSD